MKSETSFPLPLNRHGHMTIKVTGLGLTGKEGIARLESGYRIYDHARVALCQQVYSNQHRLVKGEQYRLVIVQSAQMRRQMTSQYYSNQPLREYREFGACFKYQFASAEVALHLREVLTDEQLIAMGITSLMVVHKPIRIYSRYLVCLHVVQHSMLPALGAGTVRSLYDRPGIGAVAFLDTNP